MVEVSVPIPNSILTALRFSPESMRDELRLVAAIKLYEQGRLSSGAAAELAGLSKPVFLTKLGEYGAPSFCLSPAEIESDVNNA